MQHTLDATKIPVITEKLSFKDSLNNKDVELTCDWSLNRGVVSAVGKPIADQLADMGFDAGVVDTYKTIYSDANVQSLVMMMFAGIQ